MVEQSEEGGDAHYRYAETLVDVSPRSQGHYHGHAEDCDVECSNCREIPSAATRYLKLVVHGRL
jgi:hypothetical protein